MATTLVQQTAPPGTWARLRPHMAALALYLLTGSGIYALLDHSAETTVETRRAALPKIEIRLAGAAGDDAGENRFDPPKPAAFVVPEGMHRIALVMTDLGLSDAATERAVLRLPPEVTLSFSAYAERLPFWLEQGAVARHETLIAAPMEPKSFPKDDPGPMALMARNSVEENRETVEEIMALGKGGYLGFSSFMGTRFMTERKKLLPFFETLKERGLLFVDTTQEASAAALEAASETGISYIKADALIDKKPTDTAIRDGLRQLETLAARQGYAVGVVSPYPVTFEILAEWLPTLRSKNIALVPISSVTALAAGKEPHDAGTP